MDGGAVSIHVHRLAVDGGAHQPAAFSDDQAHGVTDPFAANDGHLREQLQKVLARQGGESYLVLKRRNVEHIAIGYLALRQVGTHAADVVDAEVYLFVILCSGPHHNVRQQV